MADISLNPTNAAPGVSTEDIPATQPCFSMDRLWAILWWIAVWPWTIVRRTAVGVWTVISQAASRTMTGLCSATIWFWTGLCSFVSIVVAGLSSAAIGLWTVIVSVASGIWGGLYWILAVLYAIALWLWTTLSYTKRLFMIMILDIFLGSLDVSSDIVNGCLFVNGSEWWEKSLCCSFKLIIHFSYRIRNPSLQAFRKQGSGGQL